MPYSRKQKSALEMMTVGHWARDYGIENQKFIFNK
jgi:hypothetical protein